LTTSSVAHANSFSSLFVIVKSTVNLAISNDA
jgi:hypothetical protein